MNDQHKHYDYVILDSSVFSVKLTSESVQFLTGQPLLVANTFEHELKALQAVMNAQQAAIFRSNQKLLSKAIRSPATFNPGIYARNRLHQDVRGLISLITGSAPYQRSSGASCLVATANRALIRELIQENAAVDIYNCTTGNILPHSDFERLKAQYTPVSDADDLLPAAEKDDPLTLYTAPGKSVILSEKDGTGKEARIYQTCSLDDKLIAKVFKASALTKGKVENVRRLLQLQQTLRIEWAALPVALLYRDAACQEPAGYLMVRAASGKKLAVIKNYHRKAVWPTKSSLPFSDILQLALQLAQQVLYLSLYDMWPADYNWENFGLPQDGSAMLYMWDTDSFCHADHGLTAKAQDLYSDDSMHPAKQCADFLYQRVFSILTLGHSPFLDKNPDSPKVFRFNGLFRTNYFLCFYIPENLRRLFFQVFLCGYEPSVEALVQELNLALEQYLLRGTTLLQVDELAGRMDAGREPFYYERRQTHPIFPSLRADPGSADRSQGSIPRRAGLNLHRVQPGRSSSASPTQDNRTFFTNDPFFKS